MREIDARIQQGVNRTLELISEQNQRNPDEMKFGVKSKDRRSNLVQRLPSAHSCGKTYEERTVPVDKDVMSSNEYLVSYCSRCGVYVFGNLERNEQFEFSNPELAGKYVTFLQMRTNLEDGNPFPLSKEKVRKS